MSDQPRVLLLSQRGLAPVISRCSSYEFEDVVRSVDSVDLVAPCYRLGIFEVLDRSVNKLGRRAAFMRHFNPGIQPETIVRDYKLFFAVFQFATDLTSVNALRGWRERCEIAACWLEEIWARDLDRLQSQIALLREFDYIFTNCQGTVKGLAAATGRTVIYQPPGVDCLTFFPGDPPVERVIDVFNMGRRHPDTHRAFLALARNRGLFYLYDTFKGNIPVQSPTEHRLLLANIIKRTQFFVANRAKANEEGETAKQEEVGFRFFEGAAAGAVMIGDQPDVESYQRNFDWEDAVIHLPFGDTNVEDLIGELKRQPQRLDDLRRASVSNALRRHDWAHRWRVVLTTIGVESLGGLAVRESGLEELSLPYGGRPNAGS